MAAIPAHLPASTALQFSGLTVGYENEGKKQTIVKGVNMSIKKGEIHILMGSNGSGKSTIIKGIARHPSYNTEGEVRFEGSAIDDPEQLAKEGVFIGQQVATEIPGLSNKEFLFNAATTAFKQRTGKVLSILDFESRIDNALEVLNIKRGSKMGKLLTTGNLNEGFSGGEKKVNEIFHLLVLDPKVVLLDEPDSGLDVDMVGKIGNGLRQFLSRKGKSALIITHAASLLKHIKPSHVHILEKGKLKRSEKGDWLLHKVLTDGFTKTNSNKG
eukprot:TRINITY_DN16844_c0_g1_i1.p1 TRINITY_DN16844_c0_g1~~TRINITY_DN16844_c0_g1_i1.p1  ORF type:complete len:271 (+),score=54.42 TRINITY_DN16844_c0_g1_i1:56-868(+)